MSKGYRYKPGDNWVTCQDCGFVVRASEIKRRWDGKLVCPDDWETRHPLDIPRYRRERPRPAIVSPEPSVSYVIRDYIFNFSDGLGFTDSINTVIDYTRNIGDTLQFTDAVSYSASIQLSDTLSFSDSVNFSMSAHLTDSLTFGDDIVVTELVQPQIGSFVLGTSWMG